MLLDTLPPREHPLNHAPHFYPVASTPSRVLRHLYTRIARPLCIYGASSCRVSCFARQHGRPTHCIPCCSPGVPPYDVLSSTSLSLTESYIKSNIKSNTKSLVLSLVFSPLESRVAIDHPPSCSLRGKKINVLPSNNYVSRHPFLAPPFLDAFSLRMSVMPQNMHAPRPPPRVVPH